MTQGVHSLEDSSALLWPTQYIFSEKEVSYSPRRHLEGISKNYSDWTNAFISSTWASKLCRSLNCALVRIKLCFGLWIL